MKKIYVFLVSLLMALCARAASDTLYLFGELAGGWSPSEGIEMIKTAPGVFTIDVTVVGEKYFAFVDKLGGTLDELNAHRYSPASSEAVPVVGENDMVIGVEGGCWKISTGKYKFTVNTNANKFILSDKGPLDLYLRGDVNCWEIGDNYKFTPISQNVYTLGGVTLNAGEQFKIADANWELQFTSGYMDMTVNAVYSYQEHGYNNMAMGERIENATVILNFIDKTIIVLYDVPSGDQALYLRGDINSWGIDENYKFTSTNGYVYTLTGVTLNAGEQFKIADSNWGLRFSSGYLDMGVKTTYSCQDPDCSNMAMAETVENATVILNLIYKTIIVFRNAPSGDQNLYLRGDMNGWDIDENYKFTTADGYVYTLTGVTLNAGEQFKIADSNWGLQFSSGYRDMKANITYGFDDNKNNMAMGERVENATVILNLSDRNITVLSDIFYVAPETLYFIGDLKGNHWDPANPVEMTKTGNVFSLKDVEIETADGNDYGYFSFCTAKGDWKGECYGATFNSEGIVPDNPSRFVRGSNVWKIHPGKYDVEINFDTNRVILKTETGETEAIGAEVGEAAVYFNMQGIAVPAPEAGALYIVRRGNSISKEIAR